LPPVIVILFTCSGLVETSSAVDNRAICISIFLLKLSCSFMTEEKYPF
jgi:hypothetical protein